MFDLSARPRALTRDRGAVRELAVSLPSSNLLFATIECGIYQISICTMISLFIRSVNSSKMLRNLPLDLLIELLPLHCYVEQAKMVTYRFIHNDPIQGDIVI